MQLVVDSLCLVRGTRTILDGIGLRVQAGEALVLTGPNGAGKTTLIRALAGFLPPASGTIRLEGGDPDLNLAEQCHYVGHLNGVKASLTVEENLMFWAGYLGGGAKALEVTASEVTASLQRLGLDALAAIPAGYLSAGQKRRLALARLLIAHRPIWLLDEPATSLDAAAAEILAETILTHIAAGGLAIAATHQPLGVAGAKELRLGGAREAA